MTDNLFIHLTGDSGRPASRARPASLTPCSLTPPRASHALTVTAVGNLDGIRERWRALALASGNVFSTWEWADAWLRHLAPSAAAHVAIAEQPGGEPSGVLPLCVVRRSPIRLVQFIGTGPADQLGPVCAVDDQAGVTVALKRYVLEVLGHSGLFVGERIPGEDLVLQHLSAPVVRSTPSPRLPLHAGTFDNFLSSRSRNFRSQVRRRERALARAGRLVYRMTRDPEEVGRDMATLFRLHAARWGKATGAFRGARAAFHLDFARSALENGWLRLWTLELDGRPLASYYGLRFGQVESYYQMGRDPRAEDLHVGFVLLCHTIRAAFEDGLREYRFGLGGESYKLRFAEQDAGTHTVVTATGLGGLIGVAAIRAALRLPDDLRSMAWRLGGRSHS